MESILALMIPIVALIMVPVTVYIIRRLDRLKQADLNQTLLKLAENGQQLSPDLLERLASPLNDAALRNEKDLRWGIIFVAIAFGIALAVFLSQGLGAHGSMEDVVEGWAIAVVFLSIGLARLALFKLIRPGTDN